MALLTEKTVKEGYMVKRSQNKKVYTLVNYKRRWFVLTKRFLIYYDTDNEQKRKEKGRVDLSAVHSIEAAVLSATPEEIGIQGDFYPFQLGYVSDDYYILYLVALNDPERTDWIQTLRRACSNNLNLRTTFHPGNWTGKKWTCCQRTSKTSDGCKLCSNWTQEEDGDKENTNSEWKCRHYRDLVRFPLIAGFPGKA
ncbi:hypothetical protein Zmor_009532 [Zophobas morio]|uniref:PH domain-containing protein n=1 Tax=Zophobas morio TaxID=2755281 RepID=A0AA38IQU7_9CUCU|nr:hypothetical protein Zmor_009532 [Zophobas morio]